VASQAIAAGDLAGLRAQIDRGLDPDTRRLWPSLVREAVTLRPRGVGRGFEFEARKPLLTQAIHRAPREMALLLIERGADVNARDLDNGETPLHAAALNGDVELVRLLLARGADPLATTHDGATPRREGSRFGHRRRLAQPEVERLLQQAEAERKQTR
jgi:hypothetical protein